MIYTKGKVAYNFTLFKETPEFNALYQLLNVKSCGLLISAQLRRSSPPVRILINPVTLSGVDVNYILNKNPLYISFETFV